MLGQRYSAAACLTEKAAMSLSDRPASSSNARVCSPRVAIRLPAATRTRNAERQVEHPEGAAAVLHCTEALRGRRPAANIVRLAEEDAGFEPWYPESER